MAEHTPGPWTYDYSANPDDTAGYMVMTQDIAIVAHVWADAEKGISGGIVEANARLIAAAPDLLAALVAIAEGIGLRDFPEEQHVHCGLCEEIARRAIEKAAP